MAEEKVIVSTGDEIKALGIDSDCTHHLIRYAQEADAADRQLTIKDAVKKYKKACFWAMILSGSLVMEGYDLVIVGYPEVHIVMALIRVIRFLTRETPLIDHFILWTNPIQEPLRDL